jgi:hypothetical protein
MRRKIVIDTRNGLSHTDWQAADFKVHILGDGHLISADESNRSNLRTNRREVRVSDPLHVVLASTGGELG